MTDSFTIRQWVLTAALAGSMCVPVRAQTVSSEQIFAELVDRNQARAGGLLEYMADRVYRVSDGFIARTGLDIRTGERE